MVCICILVVMHIVENKSKSGKNLSLHPLARILSRGRKGQKRTIANLSNCTPQEISAIKLALNHKDDLGALGSLSESIKLEEGLSVGAVWCEPGCKGIGYREIAGE